MVDVTALRGPQLAAGRRTESRQRERGRRSRGRVGRGRLLRRRGLARGEGPGQDRRVREGRQGLSARLGPTAIRPEFRGQSGQTPTFLSDPARHNGQMKTLLNIIWLVFGGFWLALGYFAAGIICCLLIVTIPWGIASFRIAAYTLWPFGRMVVDKPGGTGVFSLAGERHLAGGGGHLDRDRPRGHGLRHGGHHHRHPAGHRQPEAHPGEPDAAGQADRAHQHAVHHRLPP